MLQREAVMELVKAAIREVVEREVEVSETTELSEFGVDSLDAVEIELTIERDSGNQIRFDDESRVHPTDTVGALVDRAMRCRIVNTRGDA